MNEKSSGRLIQVSLGILLVIASGLYLWRDTLLPILRAKPSLDAVSDAVRLGIRYWSWKDRAEEARAAALKADRERQRGATQEGKGDVPAVPEK